MLARETSREDEARARRHILWHVGTLPDAHFRKLLPALPSAYRPCNPSIVATEKGYLIACRTVNYTQQGQHFTLASGEHHYDTRPFLLEIDSDGGLVAQREITCHEPALRETRFRGFEDCRLLRLDGRLYFAASTVDRHPSGLTHVSLCEIDSDGRIERHVPLVGDRDNRTQKNWLPFECGGTDPRLCALYSYDPVTVLVIDPATGAYSTAVEAISPVNATEWHGSAGPIPWPQQRPDGWLVLVHEVCRSERPPYRHERVYVHRFVEFSAGFAMRRWTRPFVFFHQGVEFAAGMVMQPGLSSVLISLGSEDAEALLCRVPASTIDRLLADELIEGGLL